MLCRGGAWESRWSSSLDQRALCGDCTDTNHPGSSRLPSSSAGYPAGVSHVLAYSLVSILPLYHSTDKCHSWEFRLFTVVTTILGHWEDLLWLCQGRYKGSACQWMHRIATNGELSESLSQCRFFKVFYVVNLSLIWEVSLCAGNTVKHWVTSLFWLSPWLSLLVEPKSRLSRRWAKKWSRFFRLD